MKATIKLTKKSGWRDFRDYNKVYISYLEFMDVDISFQERYSPKEVLVHLPNAQPTYIPIEYIIFKNFEERQEFNRLLDIFDII